MNRDPAAALSLTRLLISSVAFLALLCLELPAMAQPATGKIVPLEISLDDGTSLSIPLVLCSPPTTGEGAEPSPNADSKSSPNSRAYLMATTELSFDAFQKIAPQLYESVIERWKGNSTRYRAEIEKMIGEAGLYPVIGLELSEVANVFEELNTRVKHNPLSGELLSTWVLRLPSASEWEHAMRSGKSEQELPYFNSWEAISNLPEREQKILSDVWSQKFPGEPFNGTQVDLKRLVDSGQAQDIQNYLHFFNFFLKGVGRSSWEDIDALESARIVSSDSMPASATNWGVQGAHRGYPEWVIMSPDQKAASERWPEFLNQSSAEQQGEPGLRFALAGANRQPLIKTKMQESWSGLILAGGPKMNGNVRVSATPQETIEGEWWANYSPGMRIAVLESLRPDWFEFVRTSANADSNSEVKLSELNQYQVSVQRLSLNPQADVGIVKFYLAMVNLQSKNSAEASRVLRELAAAKTQKVKLSKESLLSGLTSPSSTTPAPAPSPPKRSEEQIYLSALSSVLEPSNSSQ